MHLKQAKSALQACLGHITRDLVRARLGEEAENKLGVFVSSLEDLLRKDRIGQHFNDLNKRDLSLILPNSDVTNPNDPSPEDFAVHLNSHGAHSTFM